MRDREYKIDKGTSLPIYQQLKEFIKGKIEQGEFKPGDRIPTEYELCEEFAISRAPVRQALADLVNEGLLHRQQGSGTFVNHQIPLKTRVLRVMITDDSWTPPLRKAVRLYNKERQSQKLRLEIQTLGRPQLYSKIVSAVGQGKAPDLALIDRAWETEFANLHFLRPLDKLDFRWVEDFKADLFPAFVNKGSVALYGIQPEASASMIWYRRDWFHKQGIEPPHRWDELIEVTQHLKVFKEFPLAFVGGPKAGETTTYQLLPFLWSAGGDLLSEGRVALDEKAISAVSFLVDLVHKHRVASPDVVSFDWDRPARLFAQGKVALAVGGSYEKVLIQGISGWDDEAFRERVGCIPIPAGPGGENSAVVGGMVYVVFQQSRNAKLALEILKRVVSPPLIRQFCVETGRTPTRISVVQTLDPEKCWFSYEVSKLLQNARARPDIPQYAKVSEQFQLMIENAISRRMSPEEAVEKAREIMEVLVSQGTVM